VLHIGGPVLANLLLAMVPVLTLAHRRAGFLFLFAPDFSWIAVISGSFAAIWMFVRTWLTLRILRKPVVHRSSRGSKAKRGEAS
jgi:hypothetical protein